jgi:hypothetical protein
MRDEENDTLAQQLLDAESVAALWRIRMGHQMHVKLANEIDRIRRIRRDFRDNDRHSDSVY